MDFVYYYDKVKLEGHTFEPVLKSNKALYSQGVPSSFQAYHAGDFSGHDFFDSTTALLNVIVAGGGMKLCSVIGVLFIVVM